MTHAEVTTLWARAFADEIARAGVREVIIAPGSRSTPLVLAVASDGRFRVRVHLDERSAAFFALGYGKATGTPAAVLTTSGTAAANLLPAVVEAAQSETPLLLLTADRPHRLRGQDANQVIDQVRLFGPYAKAFHELSLPELEGPSLRHLRALAGRVVACAVEAPAGPVHVNLPFDKPLEPGPASVEGEAFTDAHPLAAMGRPAGEPFVRVRSGRRLPTAADIALVAELLRDANRPVLVAGPCPQPEETGPAVVGLCAAAGVPLLADPLSGARWGPSSGARIVSAYDLFLRDETLKGRLAPDLVLRVGAGPTSSAVHAWLAHHNGIRHVVVDGGGRWKDHGALVTDYLHVDAAELLASCTAELSSGVAEVGGGAEWRELWHRASSAAEEELERQHAGVPHEGDVVRDAVAALPSRSTVFVSSSMPVRDLDAFAPPREAPIRALGNRGASGIDGVVSAAFGASAGAGDPTLCILGDLAFFHDQNGLLWSREPDAPVVFLLIDNDGGGIFHMLPVREQEPHFTRLFATPHGLDLRHAAELHAIPFRDVEPSGVGAAVTRALDAGGTRVIRVRTNRIDNERRHREVAAAVAGSVVEALG